MEHDDMTDPLSPPRKSGAANHRGNSNQDVGTPWEFIRAVEAKFGPITHDLAASAENAKAGRYYCEAQDSLSQPWHKLEGTLWLNPGFGDVGPWARKCYMESKGYPNQILMLIPSSTDTAYWWTYIHEKACVWFLSPRIKFEGSPDPFPKPLSLCQYGAVPGYRTWRWKP